MQSHATLGRLRRPLEESLELQPGETTLLAWDKAGVRRTWRIVVKR
ncbi:hypothetical protein [Corallococcus sicarius]|nr:hypothetical protein [Corallococcus sicarius]